MDNKSRKLVGLVACGSELYRKYLLEQMSSQYDVWLFLAEDVSWQQPYIKGVSRISDYSNESLRKAVEDVIDTELLSGLVCWDERYIIATADVATTLGFPSAGIQGIRGCRDKALSRQLISDAGLQQPACKLCLTVTDALSFACEVGYPLVVKPRGMGGSIGVALVSDADQLSARFSESFTVSSEGADDFKDSVLVEEYLTGPEISVDGYCINGRYQHMFIARKNVGMHPHFEEIGHVVDSNDPLLKDSNLISVLEQAHRAIAFENGITHTELKITPKGYVIVEINGRLGGDLIPYLASLATGIKPGIVAARVACSEQIDIECSNDLVAVIEFKYPDTDIHVSEIVIPARVANLRQVQCVTLAAANTFLALPPTAYMSRAAFVIAVDKKIENAQRLVESIIDEVKIVPSAKSVTIN
ncbi:MULTISPECIES: acetyl-CoA carboxylase biotin carboxylase subunit family protein [unclassified Serratia (in: enterobacteria)]|uniref:ATP-grasp domain-containing protein n=1 Tax=unclassified Serratia (in: enterobacteria) TaxID=2647522 RepID=UPI00046972FD|nr:MULTISPECIES: ATP-grasp domain-containing protein [unclassified Serratia (in: enterobacteria)]